MGSVRAQRALGLVSIGLLAGGVFASLHAGWLLAAGIFAGLLAIVSVIILIELASTCVRAARDANIAIERWRETERSLASAKALLASVLEGLPHPVALVAMSGRIELCNKEASALGLAPGAAIATLPPWVREAIVGMPAAAVEQAPPPRDGDAIRVPADGQDRLFLSRAIALKGSAADPGVLVILTDVTDARQANEARSKRLSTLSHDLKTPMTSIQMSIHLLLEDAASRLSARQLEFLEAARDDAHKLNTLIEEMVGAARSRT